MSTPREQKSRTMTVKAAAEMLGISRTTAYECVRRGSIPSIRLGGRIIVPTQAIEQLLAVGSSPSSNAAMPTASWRTVEVF